jgi:hypothetical protein
MNAAPTTHVGMLAVFFVLCLNTRTLVESANFRVRNEKMATTKNKERATTLLTTSIEQDVQMAKSTSEKSTIGVFDHVSTKTHTLAHAAAEQHADEPLVFGYPAHLRQVLNDHASGRRVLRVPENLKKKIDSTSPSSSASALSKKLTEVGAFLDMPDNKLNDVPVPLEHIDHIISTLDTFHVRPEDGDGETVEKIEKLPKVSLVLLDEGERDEKKEDARVTDLKYTRHLARTRTLTAEQHTLIHDVGMYGQAERKAKEIAALFESSNVQEHADKMNSATNAVTDTIDILNNFLEEAHIDSQKDQKVFNFNFNFVILLV